MSGSGRWREGPATWISAVFGVLGVVVAVVAWRMSPDDDVTEPPQDVTCAQTARGPQPPATVDPEVALTPPENVTVDESSDQVDGRFTLTLRWRSTDERASSEIAIVTGRYGTPVSNGDDFPTAGDRQLPDTGECGTWLRRLDRAPAVFEGMWPSEVYCFRVWSTDDDGARGAPEPSPQSLPTCIQTGPA